MTSRSDDADQVWHRVDRTLPVEEWTWGRASALFLLCFLVAAVFMLTMVISLLEL